MVSAWDPACVLPVEACLAYEDILYGIVEHVSHVQHTGHIGWGDYYGVWLSAVWLACEKLVVCPVLVPLRLDRFRVVILC